MRNGTHDIWSGSWTDTRNSMLYSCSLSSDTTSVNTVRKNTFSIPDCQDHILTHFTYSLQQTDRSFSLSSFHCVVEIGASFAENFYGLKRVRAPRVVKHAKVNIDDESVASSAAAAAAASISALPGSNKLRERDIRKSLLFLVWALPCSLLHGRHWKMWMLEKLTDTGVILLQTWIDWIAVCQVQDGWILRKGLGRRGGPTLWRRIHPGGGRAHRCKLFFAHCRIGCQCIKPNNNFVRPFKPNMLDLYHIIYIVATIECSDQGNGAQVIQEGISIRKCALPAVDLGSLHRIPLQQNTLLFTMASPHRHRSQAYERRRLCKNLFYFVLSFKFCHYITLHLYTKLTSRMIHLQSNNSVISNKRPGTHPREPQTHWSNPSRTISWACSQDPLISSRSSFPCQSSSSSSSNGGTNPTTTAKHRRREILLRCLRQQESSLTPRDCLCQERPISARSA